MSRGVCEACGTPLDGEHPSLCGYCAVTIDHDTDGLLEREAFDLGGGSNE